MLPVDDWVWFPLPLITRFSVAMATLCSLDLTIDHLKGLSVTMDNMRQTLELTDVSIEVEGHVFPAHRLVLCAASPFFRGMFNSRMQEATNGKIKLNDLNLNAVEVMLEYIYSGKLRLANDVENIKSILLAAHLLQMESLYRHCFELLCSEEKLSECFAELWNLCELYDEDKWCARILEFVQTNFVRLTLKPQFLELTSAQLKCILRTPGLNCTTDALVQGVLLWVEHDKISRQNFLCELFGLLDLKELSSDYMEILQKHELVQDQTQLLALLLEAATRQLKLSYSANIIVCFGSAERVFGKSYVSVFNQQKWARKVLPFILKSGMAIGYYKNHFYFIGGGQSSAFLNDTVLRYCLDTNSAEAVATLHIGRTCAGAAELRDKLFVVGGISQQKGPLAVECYNSASNTWQSVAPTNKAHLFPQIVQAMDHLMVVGSSNCSNVELYNPDSDQWTNVAPLSSINTGFRQCVAVAQNKVYWLNQRNTLYAYNYLRNKWEEVFAKQKASTTNMTDGDQCFFVLVDESDSLCKFYPNSEQRATLCGPTDIGEWASWPTIVINKTNGALAQTLASNID